MNECEHNTATVLHDFGKFSILKCDWGCNEFLIELELGKNAVTTFTASELLHLRRVAAAKDAEIARLRESIASARAKLQATQHNWQEECLFDCNDILTQALRGEA